MANHSHERHDPGTARDQKQWPTHAGLPHEITADRPAHLDQVARYQDIMQVWRDFAVFDSLDSEIDFACALRLRGNRIAPLRLIAVFRGQPHVVMLAGTPASNCSAHVIASASFDYAQDRFCEAAKRPAQAALLAHGG